MLSPFIPLALIYSQMMVAAYGLATPHIDDSLQANTSEHIHPRYFSLDRNQGPPLPNAQWHRYRGPWPWDASCKKWLITYCYENEQVVNDFATTFLRALGKWAPAMGMQSDLAIRPDPSCVGPRPDLCVCGDDARDDSVRLKLGPGFQATIGYLYGDDTPGRHFLEVRLAPDLGGVNANWQDAVIMWTAHEIGHVLGFHHEHQRADAGQYIKVQCSAVKGYKDAWENLLTHPNHPRFLPAETLEDRMGRVCTEVDLAAAYFPTLINYLPGGQANGLPPDVYEQDVTGPFDHKSIMLYDSRSAAEDFDLNDKKTWSLIHTQPMWPEMAPGLRYLVVQGGSDEYSLKSVSLWDIYRVAQLYPKGGPNRAGPAGGGQKRNDDNSTDMSQLPNNSTDGYWGPVAFVSLSSPD